MNIKNKRCASYKDIEPKRIGNIIITQNLLITKLFCWIGGFYYEKTRIKSMEWNDSSSRDEYYG